MNSLNISPDSARIDALAQTDLFAAGSGFSVLRLDLLHPEISGNKWFKLQGYLDLASRTGRTSLLTFGGPWSNHLVAVAAAGKELGWPTTGIVRGEAPSVFSPSLLRMRELGMTLRFSARQDYDRWKEADGRSTLEAENPGTTVIPEGGLGEEGRSGAAAIAHLKDVAGFTHLCQAVGTGTTIAGIAMGAGAGQQLIGIPVLKGTSGHAPVPAQWMTPAISGNRIRLVHGFDQGGYARANAELLAFMNRFYAAYHIPSDFVYTGKLFFAIARLSKEGFFPTDSRVLMIHSGGLQGNRSLPAHSLHF